MSIDRIKEATTLGAVPVPGFDGYFVTISGCVFSARGVGAHKPMRQLRQALDSFGYRKNVLARQTDDGPIYTTKRLHRIVAMAHLPPPPTPHHVIRHLDGDVSNNHADNLAWGTQAENIDDKRLHGTLATGTRNGAHTMPHRHPRGSSSGSAKLNDDQVIAVRRRLALGEAGSRIAREMGVAKATISAIKTGRTWAHLGTNATRADGKTTKGPGFVPPDIHGVLVAQGWTQ